MKEDERCMNTLKIKEMVLEPGRPKVAVPLVGITHDEIIEECRNAAENLPCDIIEWRADYYLSAIDELDTKLQEKELYLEIVKLLDEINYVAAGKPIIFTVRRKGEGGMVELNTTQYINITELVAQSGLVDIIDVEIFDENRTLDEGVLHEHIGMIHEYGCKAMLSYHCFKRMPKPAEIVKLMKNMKSLGADVCKLAAIAKTKTEAEQMLKASAFLTQQETGPLVMIAMGECGTATRIAAGRYGSCITFASGSKASAPGQVDAFMMKKWLDDYYGETE